MISFSRHHTFHQSSCWSAFHAAAKWRHHWRWVSTFTKINYAIKINVGVGLEFFVSLFLQLPHITCSPACGRNGHTSECRVVLKNLIKIFKLGLKLYEVRQAVRWRASSNLTSRSGSKVEFTSMIALASLPNLMQRNQTDKIQTQKSEQELRISYVTKS